MEEVRHKQLNDLALGKVLCELKVIPVNSRFCGFEWNQPSLKRYKQIKSQLQLINGALVRNYKVEPFSNLHSVIVALDAMKTDFLTQAHDDAGHQGIERTLSRLKYLAYWVGMVSDVNNFVTSCEICQKSKLPLPTRAPLLNTPISRPIHLVHVDVLEIPVILKRNRYLQVIEDAFTKWIECFPMANQKTETINDYWLKPGPD